MEGGRRRWCLVPALTQRQCIRGLPRKRGRWRGRRRRRAPACQLFRHRKPSRRRPSTQLVVRRLSAWPRPVERRRNTKGEARARGGARTRRETRDIPSQLGSRGRHSTSKGPRGHAGQAQQTRSSTHSGRVESEDKEHPAQSADCLATPSRCETERTIGLVRIPSSGEKYFPDRPDKKIRRPSTCFTPDCIGIVPRKRHVLPPLVRYRPGCAPDAAPHLGKQRRSRKSGLVPALLVCFSSARHQWPDTHDRCSWRSRPCMCL